jgi:hypothetical protein
MLTGSSLAGPAGVGRGRDGPVVRGCWFAFLGALVVVRLAVPLLALAFEGEALPGLPAYVYGPLYGDANGYYAGAREAVSAARHSALLIAAVTFVLIIVLLVAHRARAPGWLIALLIGGGIATTVLLVVLAMRPSGTPVVGWSLVWAVPLVPIRIFDPGLDPDVAFGAGLALSLAANACTVVGTAYLGFATTGRRSVGITAAGLWALWPFVPGIVTGPRGWENGTWNVDVGLNLYTEPLSTALVVVALICILRRPASDLAFVLAGLSLGFATVVKYTNGGISIVLVLVLVAFGQRRAALLVAASGLVFAPVVLAFWGKGYGTYYGGGVSTNPHPFGLNYITPAWTDSSLFTPTLLCLLVIPALLGLVLLPSAFARAVVTAPIVATVVTYSVYDATPIHPRFLFVALPMVLTLDATAVVGAARLITRRHLAGAV